MPLLNVNTKALTVFGLLMALSAFVVPLFVKKIPDQQPNVQNAAELHHHHYSKEHKSIKHCLTSIFFLLKTRLLTCHAVHSHVLVLYAS